MKQHNMRPLVTSVLSLFLVLATATCVSAEESSGRCFDVGTMSFANLTGTPGFDSVSIDSSLRLLLTKRYVNRRREKEHRMTRGSSSVLASPFATVGSRSDPCSLVELTVELEQAEYGRMEEHTRAALAAYHVFGVLSFLAPDSHHGAFVQFRVTASCQGERDTVAAIGVGAAFGSLETLSRRNGMNIATRRASWDLAYAVVEAMNDKWGLHLKPKIIQESDDNYIRRLDSWTADPP